MKSLFIFSKTFFQKFPVNNHGQLLVELLVTIGLFAIISPALLTGFVASTQGKVQQSQRTQATALLRETEESVRSVREKGWTNFANNGTFHPQVSNGIWSLISGSEVVGDFTRQVTISDVQRNNSGTIVSSGGTVDPSTKYAELTVSWTQPQSSSVTSSIYMTRYLDNLTFTETTETDFLAGTLTDVAITNVSGGEVVLGSGGDGDWCNPSEYIEASLDLPQGGKARDIKAVQGKAFTGTDVGASSNFVEIGISNEHPPVLSVLSTVPGYDTKDVYIDGNYAYVATKDNTKDVVIIDLTTNTEVGYYNDGYNFANSRGVWVVGNVGYVTTGLELRTFDLSSKTGSRSTLGKVFLWGQGNRFQVTGNYAYVSVDWGWSELQLVNVSDPAHPQLAGYANVNGEEGQEVYVNDSGTRAYLATDESGSKAEMFIIDTTNKNGSLPVLGSYDSTGMSPTGITAVPGNRVILVGTSGEEYQVIDTSDETHPVRCGGVQIDEGIYGVSAVLEDDGDAYSYIITKNTSAEFQVIQGGPGGSGGTYLPSGIFESAPFDANFTTAFNRFTIQFTQPFQTSILFQVAVAPAVGGSCDIAAYTFIGPDGTESSFFTSDGPIPFLSDGNYQNPGRCFKYRAYLSTSDSAFTPIFEETTINYSP